MSSLLIIPITLVKKSTFRFMMFLCATCATFHQSERRCCLVQLFLPPYGPGAPENKCVHPSLFYCLRWCWSAFVLEFLVSVTFVKYSFYAHVNYYFRSCVCLCNYRRVYTHPTIALTTIFYILSSPHQDWIWKLAQLWLCIAHVKILINTINTCFVHVIIYSFISTKQNMYILTLMTFHTKSVGTAKLTGQIRA